MERTRGAGTTLYSTVAGPLGDDSRERRPYARVVEQIEEEIREGRLVRGQKLPTEQQLAAHFGVTRGVVREAIKVLEATGLVAAQQGSGIYVRNDPIPALSRALTLSIRPDLASVLSLFEFREPLEVLAVELAAARHTASDLAAMRRWVEAGHAAVAADDFAAFGRADEGFHLAVVEASGNPYLRVVLGAVLQMRHVLAYMIDHAYGSMADGAVNHEGIMDAIVAGDGAAAARETRRGIHGAAAAIRAALATGEATA
jgi:DNA-binding FadR family transcriptional regulator